MPHNHNILINLCDVLHEQGKDAQAMGYVAEAVQRGDMQRNPYIRMANYFLSARRLEMSAMCFEKSVGTGTQCR